MYVRRIAATFLAAASFAGLSSAQAAIINQFADLTAWQTAAGPSIATEDFSDATLEPGLSASLGGGTISGGQISDGLAVFGLCITGGTNCPGTTIFSFAPGTTAFGADWDLSPAGPGSGIFFSVTLAGGATQVVSPGIVNPANGTFSGFYGFVSDTVITSINLGSGFTGSGETFNADNVRFQVAQGGDGGGATVPEPGTLALLASGLLLAIGFGRRKKA